MNLYNLFPSINGKKSVISGYGLLLLGVAGLLHALGNCLMSLDLTQCYTEVSASYEPLLAAFMGLGVIGIAHKSTKIDETTKKIETTGKATEAKVEGIAETTVITEKKVDNLPSV